MIHHVDEAIRTLQAAMNARELYGAEHRAARTQEQRTFTLFSELLAAESQISFMVFEDRVVFRNDTLPSSPALIDGLFGKFSRRGIECLTVTRGLSQGEITTLVDQLVRSETDERPYESTPHLQLGSLGMSAGDGQEGTNGQNLMANLDPRRQAAALQGVWRGLYEGRGCDTQALGSVVTDICTAVGDSAGTMHQLATLKHQDEYTYTHTINVGILSAALGEAVGLSPDVLHQLTLSALLHDVGKRVIPKGVLNKAQKLTEKEIGVMQRHPVEGAKLLYELDDVPELAPIVAYEHHMHLDGTGYPNVKAGWRVHLASQIVQVADVFDALRTNRPYRDALSLEVTRGIMFKDSGSAFDRTLLDVFFERVANQTARSSPTNTDTQPVRALSA